MEHYGMPEGFWQEFWLVMGAVIFIITVIPAIIRKRIGADKKKWFSYNHVNEFYEKYDWMLRVSFIVVFIIGAIVFYGKPLFLLVLSFVFHMIQLAFQSYSEWRFAENRKNYIVSLIEIVLLFIVLIGVLLWLGP
ncbi:DUF4181 domain-containing protein [Halobacillus litoralis]|uniref:DUF4181 domain-containing protein n=1 Tax=Halobacillus litoralis TaxID=45668 RepID=A0A410M9L1_9BACI|nr:DUF4181 domain-containing protein [Halobacillus litoralis]QAS51377.1 hypothetical protein HLI_03670 [Halobacillus litoralis]